MINELFLYDRDKGLFKEILKQSSVIKGSYHVSPNGGADLNANNLETYVKDPKNGLVDDKHYPMCICLTPSSSLVNINDTKWENFNFSLFFLTTNGTLNNQLKSLDKDTNTSSSHSWYDWSDMKQCAIDFLDMLMKVIQTKSSGDQRLGGLINVDFNRSVIRRMTGFSNDSLNGVSLSFQALMYTDSCVVRDYPSGALNNIVIPNLEIPTS